MASERHALEPAQMRGGKIIKAGSPGGEAGRNPRRDRKRWGRGARVWTRGRLAEGCLLQGGEVIGLGLRPIDYRPDGFEVIGAAVLIVEIIGVFPDVDAKDWGAFDSGDCFAHQGVILICGGADFEFSVAEIQPSPTGTEATEASGVDFFFELIDIAEGSGDGFGEFADGFGVGVCGEEFPEERVIDVTATVIADGGADGVWDIG